MPLLGLKSSDASARTGTFTYNSKLPSSLVGRYDLVQSVLEDMGSKASARFGAGLVNNSWRRICCLASKSMIIAMTSLVLLHEHLQCLRCASFADSCHSGDVAD
jgi:hypothetical protein